MNMLPSQSSRLACQVCRRSLVPLKDGTARNHKASRGAEDYCRGSGFRLARWEVGQRLVHHSGSVWEVKEARGGPYGDYLMCCFLGTRNWADDAWLEAPGQTMITHGEYMHRDGWRPWAESERT